MIEFIVVVLGLVSFAPGVGNYTAVRTVRVLRPLRAITKIQGMRVRSHPIRLDSCKFTLIWIAVTVLRPLRAIAEIPGVRVRSLVSAQVEKENPHPHGSRA